MNMPEGYEYVSEATQSELSMLRTAANVSKDSLTVGHRVRNTSTHAEVLMLMLDSGQGAHNAVAVLVLPSAIDNPMSGADLRNIPIASLLIALTPRPAGPEPELVEVDAHPMHRLPDYKHTLRGMSMVAHQYNHILATEPGAYAAARMAEINDKPLPTVQRWLSDARKARVLQPVVTGRRSAQ